MDVGAITIPNALTSSYVAAACSDWQQPSGLSDASLHSSCVFLFSLVRVVMAFCDLVRSMVKDDMTKGMTLMQLQVYGWQSAKETFQGR